MHWLEKVKQFAANKSRLLPSNGLYIFKVDDMKDRELDIWGLIESGKFEEVPNEATGGDFENASQMFDAIAYCHFFVKVSGGSAVDFFAVVDGVLFFDGDGSDYLDFDGDLIDKAMGVNWL